MLGGHADAGAGEDDLEGEHAGLVEGARRAAGDEQPPRRVVLDEDVAGEPLDALGLRRAVSSAQELRPEAAALVGVADGDGEVGGAGVWREADGAGAAGEPPVRPSKASSTIRRGSPPRRGRRGRRG